MNSPKKNVLLKPYNHRSFYNNKIFSDKSSPNSFYGVKDAVSQHGIEMNTIDVETGRSPDVLLFADLPYPWDPSRWKRLLSTNCKKILMVLESPLINPFNHMKSLHRHFDEIYTWNDQMVDGGMYYKLNIPQLDFNTREKPVNFNDKKLIVSVLSNKSAPLFLKILNPFKSSLYEEREKAFNFFDNKPEDVFCLYGRGWNSPKKFSLKEKVFGYKKYKNYKGEVEDKLELLSSFKFCLAFENSSAPGYITEKIFDCFKARAVPIYYGAPNIESYIPKEAFIHMRDFNSLEALMDHVRSIEESEYNEYISKADDFMSSKTAQDSWSQAAFIRQLVSILK